MMNERQVVLIHHSSFCIHHFRVFMMSVLIIILSLALVVIVLWDAFETIVLPRRVTRRVRLTSLYYRVTWRPWRAFCLSIKTRKRREALLSVYGPLSLLALLSLWAVTLIFS